MRRRFDRSAIASSDGAHIHILHDRKSGTTGRTTRTAYAICSGKKHAVTDMQAAMLAQAQRIYLL